MTLSQLSHNYHLQIGKITKVEATLARTTDPSMREKIERRLRIHRAEARFIDGLRYEKWEQLKHHIESIEQSQSQKRYA